MHDKNAKTVKGRKCVSKQKTATAECVSVKKPVAKSKISKKCKVQTSALEKNAIKPIAVKGKKVSVQNAHGKRDGKSKVSSTVMDRKPFDNSTVLPPLPKVYKTCREPVDKPTTQKEKRGVLKRRDVNTCDKNSSVKREAKSKLSPTVMNRKPFDTSTVLPPFPKVYRTCKKSEDVPMSPKERKQLAIQRRNGIQKRIINTYDENLNPPSHTKTPMAAKSTSCINREANRTESERLNRMMMIKLLTVKSTITAFR